jgi:hypothetical protein
LRNCVVHTTLRAWKTQRKMGKKIIAIR